MIKAQALIDGFQKALDEKAGYIWGTAGITWTEARQQQKINYMIQNYGDNWIKSAAAQENDYYSAARYGAKWIGHTVYDCSGLFKSVFEKNGGSIAHGSNSIWDRYCTAKGSLRNGQRTDGKELLPGTAVFTLNDKTGKHPHIGLYVGDGKVIEAKGTQYGVVESRITDSKWKCWGELKGVEYPVGTTTDTGDPITQTRPTIRKGSKGEDVRYLQQELINNGYSCGPCGADGDFGSATLKAVKAFQKDHGLTVDGIVGKATWTALELANTHPPGEEQLYTVTIPGLKKDQAEALCKQWSGATMKTT